MKAKRILTPLLIPTRNNSGGQWRANQPRKAWFLQVGTLQRTSTDTYNCRRRTSCESSGILSNWSLSCRRWQQKWQQCDGTQRDCLGLYASESAE